MAKKIIHLDKNTRILLEPGRCALQYRRRSKGSVTTWRTPRYFPDLVPMCEEYVNSAPERSENAMRSIENLIETIRKAEKNIRKMFRNLNW